MSSAERFLPPPPSRLFSRSRWALFHAALVITAASWMFGGKIWWSKPILCALVTPAIVLTLWEGWARRSRGPREARLPFLWLAPMILLGGLIIFSAFVPNLIPRRFGQETLYFVRPLSIGWPSSADGEKTLRELWLLFGCYLVGFNVFICVRSRRALRALFLFLACNALLLAVFGTLQKFTGQDIFFGLQRAPHGAFFSTFIYHNHWGAFTLLMVTLCLGLFFHYLAHSRARNLWHSPATLGLLAIFSLAITVPLSTSRSSTLLTTAVLVFALVHGVVRLARLSRHRGTSSLAPLSGMLLAVGVATLVIYKLGEHTIAARLETTRQQLAEIESKRDIGQRRILYTDTIHMASEKPLFGWGLESYERVFPRFNSTPRSRIDGLPIYYQEAHSDWLQSLAEIGAVGTTLLVLAVAWPLWVQRRRLRGHPTAFYPLLGCGVVVIYATVEFPLANPAVVAAWWASFFGGLRYAALSETT
ncbi:MAG TPA: O-antigen ligase family protein [Opitutaceae bacterium]|nr:O-antigen ligase family protein [Opitutaceae bacterium]